MLFGCWENEREAEENVFVLFCFSVLLVVTKKSGVICVVRVYEVVLICVW